MRVAFYAPIKPPDHPIASGDRVIARNLVKALEMSGHEVALASRFIAYSKRPEGLAERRAAALVEAEAAAERLDAPDLVLTYHPYCKAPDWIGPRLAGHFGVPYVTVEAARSSVEPEPWARWREEAQAGMRRADLHVWLKPTDRAMLLDLLGRDAPLAHLPPFVDVAEIDAVAGADARGAVPRILIVGQMRPGKKAQNHRIAAEALAGLDLPFEAVILGDGPARPEIEAAYGRHARLAGAVEWTEVIRAMRGADVLLWPGWREPIGMVYLEAAACALPAVATADMGVPLVVGDGETGLLAPPLRSTGAAGATGDAGALRRHLATLLTDKALRERLGHGARARVVSEHSLDAAARTLDKALVSLRG